MMVTAEKGIGVFQLDQKYFELPSVVRRDVGKSGNWPAHPNTRFVMDGIKPRITLPGSNQGGGGSQQYPTKDAGSHVTTLFRPSASPRLTADAAQQC